ncbi:MAG: MBL fold metallo-hydrolase [Clostridia bacterium]|nr:MBL fold metallo-hydrolase [Clostridia bacterium]
MLKRLFIAAIAMLLLLVPALSLCEAPDAGCVINLIENPDAQYAFDPDAQLLEIIFPRIFSSDCSFIRFGEETMLIDSSTESEEMHARIREAIELVGIDHFDIAYNSHPHRDHIMGFPIIHEYAPFKKFLITFPADFDWRMRKIVRIMEDDGVPVEQIGDGDHLSLGANGEVSIRMIQRNVNPSWPVNDRSAMLFITYGDRTFLMSGDNESRSQKYFAETLPEGSLKADILKYPHHGHAPMMVEFRAAVDPQLCITTGAANVMKDMKKHFEEIGMPYLIAYQGITRMRTDGKIWVVDRLQDAPTE